MKTLILALIIVSFLQSTIIPVDLVLIILICRSYIRSDRANLFLAFGFGLFNGHLNLTPLGLQSFIYLILVGFTEGLSRSRLAGNSLMIVPLILIFLTVNRLVLSIFMQTSFQLFPFIFWQALIALPVFYLVRSWEERFIVRKEIKLKL